MSPIKGMDVSHYQGDIDFNKAKADGIEFAMIRAGYGWKDWENQTDRQYYSNMSKAKRAGVARGAYLYSYALTPEDAKLEADFFLHLIGGYHLEYPVAYDVEDASQANLGKERLTEIADTFLTRVPNAGYYVCLYTNLDWITYRYDMNKLKKFDVWYAQYNDRPTYNGQFGMWQHTSKGKVNGVSGNVDLDWSYVDYPSVMKRVGLNGFPKNCGT